MNKITKKQIREINEDLNFHKSAFNYATTEKEKKDLCRNAIDIDNNIDFMLSLDVSFANSHEYAIVFDKALSLRKQLFNKSI